jgi:hypothetical protein
MKIRLQDVDLSFGGEGCAISCPVGVHPVTALMLSLIASQRSSCATGALSHNNNHPERVLLRDFKY